MTESGGVTRQEWRALIKGKKDINKISRDRIRRSLMAGV